MEKLSQWIKNIKEKIGGLSKKKKIAGVVIAIGIIGAIVSGIVYCNRPKYAVLFSNMDQNDVGTIYNKLKEKKINFKVQGKDILVQKDKVDSLRMEVLSEVPIKNGSQGFELLDKTKFGATDEEMKINYQRALQGEIERTIKSFPEIDDARVHLVIPKESAFIKETEPAKASITLKLKPYKNLTKDQVKAIVALVSGSVKNLPRENVEVNDTHEILTKDLFDEDKVDSTDAVEKQQSLKKEYEKNLESRLLAMLEAVYGKDKVKVKINADLNFDAAQRQSTIYDPKHVVVSEKSIKDTTNDKNVASGSPVDDAMGNRVQDKKNGNVTTHEENTKNYEISKTEDKTIKAPGSVNRVTASVILDGVLDNATKTAVENSVKSAVGYDEKRGDSVSVEGIPFDTSYKDSAKKDLEDMNKEVLKKKQAKMYALYAVLAAIILGAIIAFIIKKRREKAEEEALEEEELEPHIIDQVIDDNEVKEEEPKFKPIELEEENEQTRIEKEIRKYAMDKPEQVVEIIKSWLAEDEG